MKKINVGILFGGKSAEHEVSLQSAKNVLEAMDREKYNPILIGISKEGRWLLNDESSFLINSENPKLIKLNGSGSDVAIVPKHDHQMISLSGDKLNQNIDVVFPILHGPLGEDGTIQGLLKLAEIPFVGAGVAGSAIGMDKDVMKRLLRDAGISIGRFITLSEGDPIPSFEAICKKLGLPFYIKPSNMGSSVGVSCVNCLEEYDTAINHAFEFDLKILIEENINGREIECAVLGNRDPKASVPGEVIPSHNFYSYEAKYIDENGAALKIPAELPKEIIKKIQALAVKTFKTLSCEGLGRVDLFLKKDGQMIVNEINTIPGFTSISMYPMLWEASGVSYTQLISDLIDLAMERHEREQKLKTSCLL